MVELPEAWEPVVKALLRAPIAWQTPAQVAEALGRDVEETADLLCLMNVAGWIDVWDAEPEPRVTLSPLAAERLRIHLVESGATETPRWARAGDPLPPRPKARNVSRLERSAALDIVPDPGPSPDQEAERFEQADRHAARSRSRSGVAPPGPRPELPFPTLLLGQGLSPWPGPARQSKSPCPACGGRPLRSYEYCLCCDRWGLDSLLPAAVLARRERPTGPHRSQFQPVDPTRRERLAAEREREKRKDRRAAKLQAKIEAERLRKHNPNIPPRDQPRNERPNPASDKARS